MSFLRPTVASRSRANATREELEQKSTSSTTSPAVQPPPVPGRRPFYTFGPSSSAPPAAARGEAGLRTRVGSSLPPPASSAVSLEAFNAKCDSVMQRAQELLERAREQEALVNKSLEERLSLTPVRRAGSASGPSALSPAQAPVTPGAPPNTPATAAPGQTSPAPAGSAGSRASALLRFLSPLRSPSRQPLYERVRTSLQRVSGVQPPAPAPSPAPTSSPSPAHRKSVRFVSPDKLESVTPTRRVLGENDEEYDGTSEASGGAAALTAETTALPQHHVAFTEPEAPAAPPSRKRSRSRSTSGSRGRASSSATATPPTSPHRKAARDEPPSRTPSPAKGAAAKKEGVRATASASRSRSRSSSASRPSSATASAASAATREHHLEMIAFIRDNTIKRCLAEYTKDALLECLRAEGIAAPSPGQTKKKLLDELRALLLTR